MSPCQWQVVGGEPHVQSGGVQPLGAASRSGEVVDGAQAGNDLLGCGLDGRLVLEGGGQHSHARPFSTWEEGAGW